MAKKKNYEPPSEPWERQPNEQQQAFKAFCAYRDLGAGGAKRSLSKLLQKHTKEDGTPYSINSFKKWCFQYHWKERAGAWDDEQDRQIREELTKGVMTMRKKHADIANAMLAKALRAMNKIPESELTVSDITKIVDTTSKLERINREEPTKKTEGRYIVTGDVRTESVVELQNIDLSGLTNGDLEKLDELVSKLAPE